MIHSVPSLLEQRIQQHRRLSEVRHFGGCDEFGVPTSRNGEVGLDLRIVERENGCGVEPRVPDDVLDLRNDLRRTHRNSSAVPSNR